MIELSRGIMLEGVSCAGKTSTMYEIKKLFATNANLERNIVMLGEHYTQVLNSINGELRHHSHDEHIEMLLERVSMIEGLHKWANKLGSYNRRSRGLYTVFERGLLNHLAYYEDYNNPAIIEIGERFAILDIEAIVLVISDAKFVERSKLRCEQMKESKSERYHTEYAEQAKRQQESLLMAAYKSNLAYRIICTDLMKWEEYAKEIVMSLS